MYCYQASDIIFNVELVNTLEEVPEGVKYIEVPDGTEFDYHYMYYIDDETQTLASTECVIDPPMIDPVFLLQKENTLLKAQVKAMSERSDFIEDCIAEMATKVY